MRIIVTAAVVACLSSASFAANPELVPVTPVETIIEPVRNSSAGATLPLVMLILTLLAATD